MLDLLLVNDADAFAADLSLFPLLLPLIRRLFDESGGEGVTFLLPALPPVEVPETEGGFDDADADADADAEDGAEDASNLKNPPPLVGLSSDFHWPVNNCSAAASTFRPDRRRQADRSRSEY